MVEMPDGMMDEVNRVRREIRMALAHSQPIPSLMALASCFAEAIAIVGLDDETAIAALKKGLDAARAKISEDRKERAS